MPSPIRQGTSQTLTLKFRKHQKQPKEKNPEKRKTVERGGGVKSTNHGHASRFIYVTLDSPRERAGSVDLEAPRTSYGPR